MNTFVSLSTAKLSQAGFVQLISSSLDNLEQQQLVSTDPMVTDLIARLKTNLPKLQASLKQKRGSLMTPDINKAQSQRNADITALSAAIKSYRQSRQADKLAAYETLSLLYQQYKDMKRVNMEDSMALVSSFLKKLDSDSYKSAVQTLGLIEFVTNLTDSQTKLYQLYLKRSQESTTKGAIDGLALREKMNADYQLLYKHLQNKIAFDPQNEDRVIVQLLNDIRKDHAGNVKRKKTKSKATVTLPTTDTAATSSETTA